jgi:hypothetical protein
VRPFIRCRSQHVKWSADCGKGRKYDLQMKCAPLENLGSMTACLIVTDHSDYDYAGFVRESQFLVDTRNATRGIKSQKIFHCRRGLALLTSTFSRERQSSCLDRRRIPNGRYQSTGERKFLEFTE